MEENELISVQIITYAGSARSKCFEAIKSAKAGNFEESAQFMIEAKSSFTEAHKIHAQLIQREAAGDSVTMTLLLSHAEDQLMNAEMSRDMAYEIIDLHKSIHNLNTRFVEFDSSNAID